MKHIISLGAGVQSSTMALMAKHGEITPMPDCAIFADTQAEPESVYRWLDWLEKQLPFPVHRVSKGSLSDDMTRRRTAKDGHTYIKQGLPYFTLVNGKKGQVPRRQCTYDYKIAPILKKAREIGNIRRGQKIVGVIQRIGISTDEATRRKDSREPWQQNRWPLLDMGMSRADCVSWMERNGYPKPPRSACVFCPYHSDEEWKRLRNDEPVAFERAVATNDNHRTGLFLHPSLVPLDQVSFSEKKEVQINLFENECEGMCGN